MIGAILISKVGFCLSACLCGDRTDSSPRLVKVAAIVPVLVFSTPPLLTPADPTPSIRYLLSWCSLISDIYLQLFNSVLIPPLHQLQTLTVSSLNDNPPHHHTKTTQPFRQTDFSAFELHKLAFTMISSAVKNTIKLGFSECILKLHESVLSHHLSLGCSSTKHRLITAHYA